MGQLNTGALKAQVAGLIKENARLRAELIRDQDNHNGWIDEILKHAPECMDADAAAEYIAIDYVRSLEGGTGMNGHRSECNCFEAGEKS